MAFIKLVALAVIAACITIRVASECKIDENLDPSEKMSAFAGPKKSPAVLDRKKRAADKGAGKWPDAMIHWQIVTETDTPIYRLRLKYVRCMYEYYTMIRFNETTPGYSGPYASFACTGQASSYVGYIDYFTEHPVQCCYTGSCAHEFGHLLGLVHELFNSERDGALKVNIDDIDPHWVAQYYKAPKSVLETFGYFDYNTQLLYPNNWDSTDPALPTYRILDNDIDRQVAARPNFGTYWVSYYPALEINQFYDAAGTYCSSFTDTCVNGGYLAVMDNVCQCRCPIGLASASYCAAEETTDTSLDSLTWPEGDYVLLKSKNGCPPGFHDDGMVAHEAQSNIRLSSVFDASSTAWYRWITHYFCARDSTAGTASFDKGFYCVFKGSGSCPDGFEESSIQYDDKDGSSSSTTGHIPDGNFQGDTMYKFCCRSDGYSQRPIQLPTADDFILFPVMGHCQKVQGMQARKGFYYVNAAPGGSTSGVTPDLTSMYQVHFCHYTRREQGCGGIIELTESNPVQTIQSPSYPSDYPNNKMCTWFIKTPSNMDAKVLLTFHEFDISADVSGTCLDSVEVRHGLPGNDGLKFCGSFAPHPYTSETGEMMVYFHSDEDTTASGFSATVKLRDEDNLCYKNKGREGSYSGTRNITRHYFSCIPWAEATYCHHNTFQEGDREDDLQENYCRNPGDGNRPWCYTSAETCTRDYCDVCSDEVCRDKFPDCSQHSQCDGSDMSCPSGCSFCDDSCYETGSAKQYGGQWKMAETNVLCMPWADFHGTDSDVEDENFPEGSVVAAKNYCRAPDDGDRPWCYTGTATSTKTNCAIPECGNDACFDTTITNPKFWYSGTKSTVRSGEVCHDWTTSEYSDSDFPDGTLVAAKNYCRNPDSDTAGPWCYTDSGYGYCGVRACSDHCFDSHMSNRRLWYSGSKSTTRTDEACVSWTSQSIYDDDDFPDADVAAASNYCRNPSGGGVGPWCFTAAGWDYCDVIACIDDCYDFGAIRYNWYSGTKATTSTGEACVNWPDWYWDDEFPDESRIAAKNYCRNPSYDPKDLWCFTTSDFSEWGWCGLAPCSGSACLDKSSTCSEDTHSYSATCTNDVDGAGTLCSKTCGNCPIDDSVTSCPAPQTIAGTTLSGASGTYNLGDKITYTCNSDTRHILSQWCSSSGSWKPDVNFVCGACPNGYDSIGGTCYKFMDDFVTFDTAVATCALDQAEVSNDAAPHADISAAKTRTAQYRPSERAWATHDCFDSTMSNRMNWYTGTTSTTSDGTACKSWTESYWWDDEFPDGSVEAARNYCRNPSWDIAPWCHIATAPGWGFCGIPACLDHCYNSTMDNNYFYYTGTKATTRTGAACSPWTSTSYPDSHYPDGSAAAASNYCRNPSGAPDAPWCFTADGVWDYCGLPKCEEYGCFVVNGNGEVSSSSCSDTLPYTCAFNPSARSVCKDQDNDCDDKLEDSPTMCVDYPDFAWQRCARTCGRCSDSNPNADNIAVTCPLPGASANSAQVGSESVLSVGAYVQYTCNSGHVHTAGSLIRACKQDGQLTSNEPVCSDVSTTDWWTDTETEIRDRDWTANKPKIFFSENDHYRIAATGTISQWRVYARNTDPISLVVLRKVTELSHTVIGVNEVIPKGDRMQTVDIPTAEQISVQSGDFIGVYTKVDDSGVPYDVCSLTKNPTYDGVMISKKKIWDLPVTVGTTIPTKIYGGCRRVSVSAFVTVSGIVA